MEFPRNILWLAMAALCLSYMTIDGFAQDSLRIIELSAPGQSAPVDVPAGHIFTFSLFAPDAGSADFDAAVGMVTYTSAPDFTEELRWTARYQTERWFLGPARVALRGSVAGARMQLYAVRLPPDVVSGALVAEAPEHSVAVPKGSLLTPLLTFTGAFAGEGSHLSIRKPDGVNFGYASLEVWLHSGRVGSPRLRGVAGLHNANAPASAVVDGFYYDDLDSVSPTADFVGPGTATFALPPEGERSTPIAFFCYRITPANVIGADASPPSVKVTAPAKGNGTTTSKSFVVKGSTTDNISPTSIRFRMRAPNASAYGSWTSILLGGEERTKNWRRSISLSRKGAWGVQVQAFDAESNASTVQTVTLTRQ
jgi:hypothetical protein